MANRRGNPHWNEPQPGSVRYAAQPTAFECFVQAENIPPELWPHSRKLRDWVRRHAHSKYVPEDLLDQLGIVPRITFGPGFPGGVAV